jgi:hypothetical protein
MPYGTRISHSYFVFRVLFPPSSDSSVARIRYSRYPSVTTHSVKRLLCTPGEQSRGLPRGLHLYACCMLCALCCVLCAVCCVLSHFNLPAYCLSHHHTITPACPPPVCAWRYCHARGTGRRRALLLSCAPSPRSPCHRRHHSP